MPSQYIDIDGIDALNVPLLTQPNAENECLLYCLSMVFQYCERYHPSENIRDETNVLMPEDLKQDYITVRDGGWSPTRNDFELISEDLGVLNLTLKYWSDGSPPLNAFSKIVESGLENDMPTIAVVDAMKINDLNLRGPQHAVVVTGLGGNHVVVNDPWGREAKRYPKDTIIDAWDTLLNRLVTIDATTQESLLNHDTKEANNGD